MCLLLGIDKDAQIISSGELFRKGKTVTFSCMSSLFFIHMLKLLYPSISTREKSKTNPSKKLIVEVREYYEREVVVKFMREALSKEYAIVYVPNIEETPELKRKEFRPEEFCSLPEGGRPTCLRYVSDRECEILSNHPGLGYCEAGVDFCSNLDKDSPPREGIPEEAHIYEKVFDHEKAKGFLVSQGKKPMNNKIKDIAFAKLVAKSSKIPLDDLKTEQLIWPK